MGVPLLKEALPVIYTICFFILSNDFPDPFAFCRRALGK